MTSRLIALTILSLSAISFSQAATLRVLNWSDYIDDEVLTAFTSQTGIEVDYNTFDDEDQFFEAFFNSEQPWDVIVPSDSWISFLIERNQLSKIDRQKVNNYAGLNESIMAQLANKDVGNTHSVPYMWGTTAIGVNTKAAGNIDINEVKQHGWGVLFDPAVRSRYRDCGIVSINDRQEVFASALKELGYSVNSSDKAQLQEAMELVKGLASDIKYFHSGKYADELASGEACIVLGYSGDIIARQYEFEDAGIDYFVPEKGAVMWLDVMAIPANSTQKNMAHQFISFLTEPDIAAQNSNYNAYPTPVDNSRNMIDQELLDNPAVYPDAETIRRLENFEDQTSKTRRLIRKYWVQANCQAGAYCEVPMDTFGF